jgi:hypothetical protein
MPETLRYTDLITPDDVKRDAANALNIDVTDENQVSGLGASWKDACLIAIRDVSEAIESYLDRKLIVRKWEIDVQEWQWELNRALDAYQHMPAHWPVVQVETAGVSASNDAFRLLSAAKMAEVALYAGYKRREQTVGGAEHNIATAANGLEGLTETPPDLPYDIRRVAQRLVMYELTPARQNTSAVSSVTKTAGGATAEITKTAEDVYGRELGKLHQHRRVV